MEFPTIKGRAETDYPLAKLNTWHVGGSAERVVWPEDPEELAQVITWCLQNTIPVMLLGRGSNVLLPDEGLKGAVIITTALDAVCWRGESVTAGAGVSLMRLARNAAHRGLGGLEFACGIPGTVGAATAINAGAYGSSIGDLIAEVTVLTREGSIRKLAKKEMTFGYRNSSLMEMNHIILEVTLEIYPKAPVIIQGDMGNITAKRRGSQPLEYPNAGSVFRNPPGDSAGRLIEAAGWKGRRYGDAEVSGKHANFIINRGNATSRDILRLIREIQEDVLVRFGIRLETEIRIIE